MIRNLKVLGMALTAVLALSAMVASAAFAGEYHSEIENTTIKGEQTEANKFVVPGAGTVECTTAKFTGTVAAKTATDLTIHPEYSGCKAFGFATTHVTTTGCDYTFTAPSGGTATVHIVCGAGSSIKITPTVLGVSNCTMTIGSHTPGTPTVDMTNQGAGTSRDVLVRATTKGIAHSKSCGATGENDGEYTGTVTTKGFNSGGTQVGIWTS